MASEDECMSSALLTANNVLELQITSPSHFFFVLPVYS